MWVLEDWWPTMRGLTLCWDFCRVWHWKRQYEWCVKIYMAYEEEKWKSQEDLWGLWSFYFICALGAPYYQRGCIGWVAEVQIIENYLQTKVPRQIGHIWVSDWILEAFVRHVCPQPRHVWPSPSSLAAMSQPDLSGSCFGFQKIEPDMSAPSPDKSG
jgi:hypothetical protein